MHAKGGSHDCIKEKQEAAVQTEELKVCILRGQNCEEKASIALLPIFFLFSHGVTTAHVVCLCPSLPQ